MLSVASGPHRAGWLRQGGWHDARPSVTVRFQKVARQQQAVENVPVHLSTSGGAVHVQIEYYQLLQLPRFAAISSVQQSYQRLLEDDKDYLGYSEKTFYTKKIYLRAAYSILTDDQERRSYDTNLRQHGTAPLVPVSIQDLPGVVALLRACGNPASSYSVARATLSDPSLTAQLSQQDCRDLALAGAIAALDMAVARPGAPHAAAGHQGAWGASAAYTALQHMVEQLQAYRVQGPVLHQAQQVQQDLAVAFVLEELSSSSSSSSSSRGDGSSVSLDRRHPHHAGSSRRVGSPGGDQEGPREAGGPRRLALQVLQELLWPSGGALLMAEEQEDLMTALRGRLTATEQVTLFEAAPKGAAVPPQQLYDAAMALVALAYTAGSSQYLRQAQQLLVALKGMGLQGELARDLACCSSMLGDPAALRGMVQASLAQRALSQRLFAGSSADPHLQQQQQRLVGPDDLGRPQDSSGSSSSQVEAAMEGAVGAWLQEQVLPRFPDTAGLQVDVAGWREALAQHRGLAGDVHQLLNAARASSPLAGAQLVHLLGGLVTRLRQLLPGAAGAAGSRGDGQGQPQGARTAATAQERARAAVLGTPIGGAADDWSSGSSSSSSSSGDMRSSSLPRHLGAAALVVAAGAGVAWGLAQRMSSSSSHPRPGVSLPPLLQQLRPAPSRPPPAVAAGVGSEHGLEAAAAGDQAGTGPVHLVGALWQQLAAGLPRLGGEPHLDCQPSAAMAAAAQQVGLSVDKVQQLLQRWHGGRCGALGASHRVERLRGLVTGPTLAAYQEEAAALKQGGRYCEVTLQDLRLVAMEATSLNSGAAANGTSSSGSSSLPDFPRKADAAKASALRVRGSIREGCKVYEGGRLLHSCTNSTMMEVVLVRSGAGGSWQVEEVKPLPSVMWYAMPC